MWYVLLEGNSDSVDPDWSLREKHHVEGDRAAALTRAEELCRTWCPRSYDQPSEYGRNVFRTSESSWLVEVIRERWPDGDERPYTRTWHCRVTVAELVYVREPPPAIPPERKRAVLGSR